MRFDGDDLHAEYASLRHRIGLVPQDDVLHHQLTLEVALRFAAELRLPHANTEEQATAAARVLEELELTDHAHTRVDKLSGGQRKRASVAMELLTGPALLILDGPTTGLDAALDRAPAHQASAARPRETGHHRLASARSFLRGRVCGQPRTRPDESAYARPSATTSGWWIRPTAPR